jgi:hypothetical protein
MIMKKAADLAAFEGGKRGIRTISDYQSFINSDAK